MNELSPFRAMFFWCLLLLLATTAIEANQYGTSCPCLSLEEKVEMADGLAPTVSKTLTERVKAQNITQQELDSLGVGCSKHTSDNNFEWCYVDPTNCDLKFSPSDFFKSLYYSFAACGNPDEDSRSLANLRSEDLKVVFHENYRGYQGTICDNKNDSTTCYGTVPNFFLGFSEQYPDLNITYEVTKVPEWIEERARNYTPFVESDENMSHGACVFATGLGVVDLCLGAFTKNVARGLITSFLEMGVTAEHLIVFVNPTDNDFGTMIQNVFAPFSWSLWMVTFVVLILLGLLLMVQENSWSELKETPLDRTAGLAAYDAALSFFAQESITEDDARSWGGRFTLLAIAVQILLTGASYTANLTNFLVRNGFETGIESIEDAIAQNADVCVLRNKIAVLDTTYGKDTIKYAINPIDGLPGFENRPELLPAMDEGLCECAILGKEEIFQYHGEGRHCDKQIVGTSVTELPWGIPVSDRYASPLRFKVTDYIQTGDWMAVQRLERPDDQCPEQEIDAENASLYPRHMLGAYFLSALLAFIGMVCSIASAGKKRRSNSKECVKTNVEDLQKPENPDEPASENLKHIMTRMKDDIVLDLRKEIADLKNLVKQQDMTN